MELGLVGALAPVLSADLQGQSVVVTHVDLLTITGRQRAWVGLVWDAVRVGRGMGVVRFMAVVWVIFGVRVMAAVLGGVMRVVVVRVMGVVRAEGMVVGGV